MIIIDDIEQGTEEWLRNKLGVVSASRAAEFATEPKLAPMPSEGVKYTKDGKEHCFEIQNKQLNGYWKGTNKLAVQNDIREMLPPVYGDMRQSYMAELVGQIATNFLPEEFSFKQTEWGKEYEHEARSYFEFETGLKVNEVAFIYRDKEKRFGVSPDGLIDGKKIGLELKCPFTTKVFVELACCEKIKQEYIEQCQYSMWVTGYDAWYFANYDPRIKGKKLHHVLIERDQKYMDKYDRAEEEFIRDMDKMLNKMNVKFGDQWLEN